MTATLSFFRQGKQLAIANTTLISPSELNGMGIPSIETIVLTPKLKWITSTMAPHPPAWKPIAEELLNLCFSNNIGMGNIHHTKIPTISSKLWLGILQAWAKLPTTMAIPSNTNTHWQSLPITNYPHKYKSIPALQAIPYELHRNGIDQLHLLGSNPSINTITTLTSLDEGQPLDPLPAARWLSQIPQHIWEETILCPDDCPGDTWYTHTTLEQPIIKTNGQWTTITKSDIHSQPRIPIQIQEPIKLIPLLLNTHPTKPMLNKPYMPADKALPYNLANIKVLLPRQPAVPLHMAKNKHFYKALTSHIPIPSRTRWQNYPSVAPHIPRTISRNTLPAFPNKINDLRLRIYHKALPCGYTTPKQPSHCSLCQTLHPGEPEPTRESIHHRFIECPTAKTVWHFGEQLLNKPIPEAHKLFGNPIRQDPLTHRTSYKDAIENAILGILQWCIWTHRNIFIFQQGHPSPHKAVSQSRAYLSFFTSSLHTWFTQLNNPASSLYNQAKFYQVVDALIHFPRLFTIHQGGFTTHLTSHKRRVGQHPVRPPDSQVGEVRFDS